MIPYFLCLVILGFPVMFTELAYSQWSNLGPGRVWICCPLFKGNYSIWCGLLFDEINEMRLHDNCRCSILRYINTDWEYWHSWILWSLHIVQYVLVLYLIFVGRVWRYQTYPVRVLSYDYERTQWGFYLMIMNVPSEGFIRNTMPTKLDIYMFTHKRYNLIQYTK